MCQCFALQPFSLSSSLARSSTIFNAFVHGTFCRLGLGAKADSGVKAFPPSFS